MSSEPKVVCGGTPINPKSSYAYHSPSLELYSCYMEITVKIPDEIAAQAEARRMRVDGYVEEEPPASVLH